MTLPKNFPHHSVVRYAWCIGRLDQVYGKLCVEREDHAWFLNWDLKSRKEAPQRTIILRRFLFHVTRRFVGALNTNQIAFFLHIVEGTGYWTLRSSVAFGQGEKK